MHKIIFIFEFIYYNDVLFYYYCYIIIVVACRTDDGMILFMTTLRCCEGVQAIDIVPCSYDWRNARMIW